MEKRKVYVISAIILAAVLVLSFAGFTGNVFSSTFRICEESDGGLNEYKKGSISYSYKGGEKIYTDYCYEEKGDGSYKRLSEYYCTDYDRVRTKKYICGLGCVDGSCVKAETCVNETVRQCGTSGVGMCKFGTQTCVGDHWSGCVGNLEPEIEMCSDNLDNDCDGLIDEGC